MKLSFDIPKTRISEIIECLQNESDLETRLDYFSICRDYHEKDTFNITMESNNEFFIQRMAEAAREKTEDRNCNCLFNLRGKGQIPFVVGADGDIEGITYEDIVLKHSANEAKEPESNEEQEKTITLGSGENKVNLTKKHFKPMAEVAAAAAKRIKEQNESGRSE